MSRRLALGLGGGLAVCAAGVGGWHWWQGGSAPAQPSLLSSSLLMADGVTYVTAPAAGGVGGTAASTAAPAGAVTPSIPAATAGRAGGTPAGAIQVTVAGAPASPRGRGSAGARAATGSVAWGTERDTLEGAYRATDEALRPRLAAARLPQGRWHGLARDALRDLLLLTGPLLTDQAREEAELARALAHPAGTCEASAAKSTDPSSHATQGAAEASIQAQVGCGVDHQGNVLDAFGRPTTRFLPGAAIAAPVQLWRYVWPRDAAFVAAAFAGAGLHEEAMSVLVHLAWLHARGAREGKPATWLFQARYDATGRRPDARPAQLDGAGWVLWAAGRVLAAGGAKLGSVSGEVVVMLERLAEHLLWLTASLDFLPPASPDYWELPESRLTLGIAVPTLLGLEAAVSLAQEGLIAADTSRLRERVERVRRAMEVAFAPGWGRYAGEDEIDAALAWCLPPFTSGLQGSEAVRRGAVARVRRAGGGVAPGESWRDDGISWTPQTALWAWSAAALAHDESLDRACRSAYEMEAEELLGWLKAHRTPAGCLPEKVTAAGDCAGPAPLGWTCALALLAALELEFQAVSEG